MHRAKGDRLVRASGLPVRQCPKGNNDRFTVGEFFSVPVFANIIQDTVRK